MKEAAGPGVRQPKAPFRALSANALFVGPSGSGKSVVLIRTLLDKDKLGGLFDRYELYSPNIHIDPQYKALIAYVEATTGQKKEDFCHEEFDQESIRKLMEDQRKANAYLRKQGAKRLLSACVVVDDFGERVDIVRAHGSVINSLFTRGRHLQISCYGLLLQRFKLANPTIRFNAHALYVHKLTSSGDLDALAENFSEVCGGKENFVAIYRAATKKRFGFLFITMGATPRFYNGYSSEFKINDDDSEGSE